MKRRRIVVTLELDTDVSLADFRSKPVMQKLFAVAWPGQTPTVVRARASSIPGTESLQASSKDAGKVPVG